MKYKQEYVSRLEAALNLTETVHQVLLGNKPATQQELAQLTANIGKTLEFILERMELESDNV